VLAAVIQVSILPRTEVIKKVWEYIKANDLQDPTNKKFILCDEKLQALFKKERIGMFEMNKHLSKVSRCLLNIYYS
jgi:chromatin remodeling complex protein RSC6